MGGSIGVGKRIRASDTYTNPLVVAFNTHDLYFAMFVAKNSSTHTAMVFSSQHGKLLTALRAYFSGFVRHPIPFVNEY